MTLDLFSGGLVALLCDLQGSTRPLVGSRVVGIKHGYNALCSRIIFSRNRHNFSMEENIQLRFRRKRCDRLSGRRGLRFRGQRQTNVGMGIWWSRKVSWQVSSGERGVSRRCVLADRHLFRAILERRLHWNVDISTVR